MTAFSILLPDADFDPDNCIGTIPTPRQKWRVSIGSSHDPDLVSANEIELREVPGGPDVTGTGCTYAASSTFNSSTLIGNAFDNDVSTGWLSAADPVYPVTIDVDFGVGNEKVIREILFDVSSFAPSRAPASMQVLYYDGAAWVLAWDIGAIGAWTGDVPKVFTKPS